MQSRLFVVSIVSILYCCESVYRYILRIKRLNGRTLRKVYRFFARFFS